MHSRTWTTFQTFTWIAHVRAYDGGWIPLFLAARQVSPVSLILRPCLRPRTRRKRTRRFYSTWQFSWPWTLERKSPALELELSRSRFRSLVTEIKLKGKLRLRHVNLVQSSVHNLGLRRQAIAKITAASLNLQISSERSTSLRCLHR